MKKHPWFWALVALLVLSVFVVGGSFAAALYAARLPERSPTQETLIYGQTRFAPGSKAALRVVVREVGDAAPIPGADVRVALKPQAGGETVTLFEGTTDELGTADVSFTVPADADTASTLVVETQSEQGDDEVAREVTIERDYKILITTDKPIYQPGQVIHIRALVLSSFDRVPVGDQALELSVTDAAGNKVFRRTLTTSEYGVTAADFQLANEVNAGNYKIEAQMRNTASETTVVVKHYVLPKFKVEATTDRDFYLPGEEVSGAVDARYFFGKAVEQGTVILTGYTFDVQLNEVFRIEGETDAEGRYDFTFQVPDYLVGGGLEEQVATFIVEVAVTDGAEHTERIHLRLPVARQRILIDAVPESGDLVPGVENIVYVVTAAPDGTPVPAEMTIWAEGQTYSVESGEYGLAEWRFTPNQSWQEVQISARDAQGHEAERFIYFEPLGYSPILLRPERAVARVGETLHVDLFSPVGTGSLYLDIIREGQTVSTRALDPEDGHARVAIDLTPDLYGTLELHGYTISQWGEIQRDTRIVVVDAPQDLALTMEADKELYLPGETAGLDFAVTDTAGRGVAAVLGLAAVDESVYALQEQDPGFLKLYFLLEKELLDPKYDLHGFTWTELLESEPDVIPVEEAQAQAAQASLAGTSTGGGHSLALNTRQVKEQALRERQGAIAGRVTWIMLVLVPLLPLALAGVVVVLLRRERVLGRSLALGLGLVLLLVVLLFVIPAPGWVTGPLDRVGYLIEALAYSDLGPGIVALWAFLGLVAFLTFAVRSVIKREWGRGLGLLLLLLYLLALPLLLFAGETSSISPPEWVAIPLIAALLLAPAAFLVWAAGELWQRHSWAALGSFALVGLALAAPVLALFVGAGNMSVAATAGGGALRGMEDGEMVWAAGDGAMEPAPLFVGEVSEEELDASNEALAPGAKNETGSAPEPPRLRQLFGETMAWLPELVTEGDGTLHLDLPLYDNITTWRLTALAHSQEGQLGTGTFGLRVFQDFFVDFDLPYALTQNDEVSLPVAVYNYLEQPQSVRLVLEEEPWFELLGEAEQTLEIGAGDVTVVRFPIRVTAAQGRFRPTVWAYGEQMSDATTATHDVIIVPDGKKLELSWSGRLEESIAQTVEIPEAIVPGTARIAVKVYPGIVSQVVEGMDAILQMPYGCFEQTSSVTYPNVLVLDYMATTEQTTPEIQMKAEQYINLGYQRLTTFEVPGGGFSLFGDAPADRMLTAYGLMEFTDMAGVFPVDENFVDRAARWLLVQQNEDGSWENDQGLVHEQSWSNLGNARVPVTAYVTWSLVHAGYGDEPGVQQGLAYVREHAHEMDDPYALALVANVLVAADPEGDFTAQTLDRLADMAQVDGEVAFWASEVATMMGSQGLTGSLETTALAAYAFLSADAHPDLANKALNYLIQQKDPQGTWYSTQATILALKALLKSVTVGAERTNATVTVTFDGGRERAVEVTPETYDVVHLLTFDDVTPGTHEVALEVAGEGQLMAQITAVYYLPWSELPETMLQDDLLEIDVVYDRTDLAVDDVVEVEVTVALKEEGSSVEWALVDLGTPPGFTALTEALQGRVNHDLDLPEDYPGGRVKRFETTGRQLLVYLADLEYGEPLTFGYQLRARFPVKAQIPASQAYDYYNPDVAGTQTPTIITVTE
ncbi:MAG: MG2 domain-containing protein [Anaerolineales bacterium]